MLETLGISRRKLIAGVTIAVAVGAVALPGCTVARDTAARVLGLPTSADYAAIDADRQTQLDALAAADERIADIDAQRAAAAAEAAVLDARRSQLAEQHADLAGRYADAVRAGAAALAQGLQTAIDGVREELAGLDNDAAALAAALGRATAALEESRDDRAGALAAVESLDAEVVAMEAYTKAKLAGVAGWVRSTGAQLTAWGLPGASVIANEAAGTLAEDGLLGSLLLGGGATVYGIGQRRKRRRTEDAFTEIVAVNDAAGLINDDKQARLAARNALTPEARKVFKAIQADAELLVPAKQGAIAAGTNGEGKPVTAG